MKGKVNEWVNENQCCRQNGTRRLKVRLLLLFTYRSWFTCSRVLNPLFLSSWCQLGTCLWKEQRERKEATNWHSKAWSTKWDLLSQIMRKGSEIGLSIKNTRSWPKWLAINRNIGTGTNPNKWLGVWRSMVPSLPSSTAPSVHTHTHTHRVCMS